MRYVIDHDLHIHSVISPCAADPRQTMEAILAYGLTSSYHLVGVSDHLWDHTRNAVFDALGHLPSSDRCRFLAGAEIDMDLNGQLTVRPEEYDQLDYMLISINHFQLVGLVTDPQKAPVSLTDQVANFKERFYHLFAMDLPFHKVGLAHLTLPSQPQGHTLAQYLALFSQEEWEDIFANVVARGIGIELNFDPDCYDQETLAAVLRPYQIAKGLGCKFYFGSDTHRTEIFGSALRRFNRTVDLLQLTEDDKWDFVKQNLAANK